MASENEPAKLLLPYLQRADELQKAEPLVAYYCRLYAMERGLKIPQSDRTKTTNALLVSLMKQLEKDKKSLTLGSEDNLYLEGFALNVFAKADKQDRAERADLNTAKTFYASSIFFEILNQFGPLQPDLEQKQKYAVWKAADIRKALKEGRKPLPGPPGGDDDLRVLSSTTSSQYDFGTSTSDFAARPQSPDMNRVDPAAKSVPDSDSFPQVHDQGSVQHSTSIPRQPPNFTPTPAPKALPDSDQSPRMYDQGSFQHSTSIPQPPHNFTPTPAAKDIPDSDRSYHQYDQGNYHNPPSPPSQPSNFVSMSSPSLDTPPPPSVNSSQHSIYHQPYSHQPYQPEPQHHFPQQYPSHEASPFSYPNFQSYPSFMESSLPTAPTHQPSYYQGSEASYTNSSPSFTAPMPSTPQHNPSSRNGSVTEASPLTTQKYEYDSSYQPPPEKIAEAHKAARFAVGALAFDDVSVAVDFLKKSLELLTNPSAGH